MTTLYVLNTMHDNVAGVFTSVEQAAQYLVRHSDLAYSEDLSDSGIFINPFHPDIGSDDPGALELDLGDELQAAYDRLAPPSH